MSDAMAKQFKLFFKAVIPNPPPPTHKRRSISLQQQTAEMDEKNICEGQNVYRFS